MGGNHDERSCDIRNLWGGILQAVAYVRKAGKRATVFFAELKNQDGQLLGAAGGIIENSQFDIDKRSVPAYNNK